MTWDAAQVNGVLDDVLVTVGIAVLIVRQFVWRSAEPARMLTMPALVIAVGTAYLVAELHDGFHWVGGDWVFVAELVLVAATGTAMGYVTHFRRPPVPADRFRCRVVGALPGGSDRLLRPRGGLRRRRGQGHRVGPAQLRRQPARRRARRPPAGGGPARGRTP